MNKIFLRQNLALENVSAGEIKGIAYSGKPIAEHGPFKNLIIDLSTLSFQKAKVPILRDHIPSQVAGQGNLTIGEQVLIEGRISKKNTFGKEITDLAEDGFDWELSLGVYGGSLDEIENEEINGQHINHGFVLRNGVIREVSVVALGADPNTSAEVFQLNKEEKPNMKLNQHSEWSKFACGCGGSKDSSPEELEKKFADSEEKAKQADALKEQVAQKEAEIEALKKQIADLQGDSETKAREEEIKAAVTEKNLKFSDEKIKEAAKSKEKTEMFLSLVKDMDKKIDSKFGKEVNLGSGSTKASGDEDIRAKALKLMADGQASDYMEAINMVEEKN